MNERLEVAPRSELEPGDRRIVSTEDTSIGVFNVGGDLYALENRCAHDGGPVCTGRVNDALVGEYPGPGERVRESFDGEPAIACPWHGWEYDLASGTHLGDDDVTIPTYDVEVENGVVYVLLE